MEVRIEKNPMSFGSDVWLYRYLPDRGTVIYNLDGSEREVVQVGTEPKPSFHIDDTALSALVAAGSEVLPPSTAQAKHLDDAITVRDRLLTLFEGQPTATVSAPTPGGRA